MDSKTLSHVLKRASRASGSKSKDLVFNFDDELKASLLVSVGSDAVNLKPLTSVELADGFAVVSYGKADQAFVAVEHIAAVTVTDKEEETATGGAGFRAPA